MRNWMLIPIVLVVAVLVVLPLAALTESGLEKDVKRTLGVDLDECEPMTNLASPWVEREGLPFRLDEPRGVAIDEQIYTVGGITGLETLEDGSLLLEPSDTLIRFDPEREEFEELAPLPRKLNHIGVVAYDGDLYVLGGYGRTLDTGTSRAFFRYEPEADRWTRMPDMPEPKAAMAAGVIGQRLIVAGGARDNEPVATAFAYDFGTGRWSRLPAMPKSREHVGSAALDGRLYVLGGRTEDSFAVSTAERYDAKRRRWEGLLPMPVRSGGLEAVALDGRVFAVGGGNDGAGTVTGAVQEWNPDTGRWTLLAGMRTPRHGHQVTATDDTIWAIGGSPCAYFDATESVESLRVEDRGEASEE